jgi:hypothetical protein
VLLSLVRRLPILVFNSDLRLRRESRPRRRRARRLRQNRQLVRAGWVDSHAGGGLRQVKTATVKPTVIVSALL